MSDTIVIDGEVELLNVIDGDPDVYIGGGGSQPTGTKSILLTEAGTKTEDVTDYASAEINAVTSATASGAVASFSDGAEDVPMDSCVVDIEPVQSGSGDPSPSNVRPISGWSEVKVYVSPTLLAQDATVHTVSLGQTVYGGTLDVVTGVLTVDRAMVDLGSLTWSFQGTATYVFFAPVDNMFKPSTSAGRKEGIMSSKYAPSATTSVGSGMGDKSMLRYNGTIYIRDTAYSSASDFKTAMDGVQLVYELATPQTIQLTPTEVKTLLGSNSVWADSGDISVEYKADIFLYADSLETIIDTLTGGA